MVHSISQWSNSTIQLAYIQNSLFDMSPSILNQIGFSLFLLGENKNNRDIHILYTVISSCQRIYILSLAIACNMAPLTPWLAVRLFINDQKHARCTERRQLQRNIKDVEENLDSQSALYKRDVDDNTDPLGCVII